MSKFIFLQEADWANIYAKFLIGSTNVHRSNVNDGKTRCFCCLIFDDCFAPSASVRLWRQEDGIIKSANNQYLEHQETQNK